MIRANNIHKSFGGDLVLKGAEITLEKGQAIVLSGHSGSGKTTLLRILTGLEKPDQGEVYFDHRLMSDRKFIRHPKDRKIGFVFQHSSLWTHMSVMKNIMFGIDRRSGFDKQAIMQLLEDLKISEMTRKYPVELSAGQQRRVAIARAIASEPTYLLLDEALVNLDTDSRDEIAKMILDYQNRMGFGLLIVSHNQKDLEVFSATSMILHDGKIEDCN